MIFEKTGRICEGFYMTGAPHTPVFLLDGEVPVLFDGGLSAYSFLYINGIREILGDRHPGMIFLSHSHFDHIGAVSQFKQCWPEMKVAGSPKCARILQKPNAIDLIRMLNGEGLKMAQKMGVEPICQDPFEPFSIDLEVENGQTVPMGPDLRVRAIGTPGHTWDLLSYFIPGKDLLIASEAVACREGNNDLQTEFLVDINAYIESLMALETLSPKIVCAGHYSVFSGRDALDHIRGSIRATEAFRKMAETCLMQEKYDVDKTVERIKAYEWEPRLWPKQPEPAYVMNTRQRVLTLLSLMPEKEGPSGSG